jgi:hypothetical protein
MGEPQICGHRTKQADSDRTVEILLSSVMAMKVNGGCKASEPQDAFWHTLFSSEIPSGLKIRHDGYPLNRWISFPMLPVAFEQVNRVNCVFFEEKYSISSRALDYDLLVLWDRIQELRLQLVRMGRWRSAETWHRPGPPHGKTLSTLSSRNLRSLNRATSNNLWKR